MSLSERLKKKIEAYSRKPPRKKMLWEWEIKANLEVIKEALKKGMTKKEIYEEVKAEIIEKGGEVISYSGFVRLLNDLLKEGGAKGKKGGRRMKTGDLGLRIDEYNSKGIL